MADEYVTLQEVVDRLDWTLDDDETRMAQAAVEDLSDDVRGYGRDWTPAELPRQLRTMILRAAVRYMRNPEGYIQSRAGDETVIWTDDHEQHGAASFTKDEIALIESLAGRGRKGFGSSVVVGYSTRRHRRGEFASYVPAEGTTPFPFFSDPVEPW